VGAIASQGVVDYASAATLLAFLGGLMLIAMGLLKFGFVSHFLSHPVVSGFITASAIIIALGQLGTLLGVTLKGATLPALGHDLYVKLREAHGLTIGVGAGSVAFLLLARYQLSHWLGSIGLRGRPAELIVRSAPFLVMAVLIPLSAAMSLESAGVPLVGQIPSGLPAFSAPHISWPLLQELALPAFLIALIGFIESVSVGKTLGAKRRQRIDPDQELIGLGAANTAAAISGGFPVTGGFSRSVVNFDAGAETQMASVLAALGIGSGSGISHPNALFSAQGGSGGHDCCRCY
jgi:SulP family sulfate permease